MQVYCVGMYYSCVITIMVIACPRMMQPQVVTHFMDRRLEVGIEIAKADTVGRS